MCSTLRTSQDSLSPKATNSHGWRWNHTRTECDSYSALSQTAVACSNPRARVPTTARNCHEREVATLSVLPAVGVNLTPIRHDRLWMVHSNESADGRLVLV